MRIKNAKFTIGFVCIYFQKSEEVRQNFEHSSGCENITYMSPLWHISASDKESPEFSRYDAYRRILSRQVVAGILLTEQYANGCYQFKYMETDVMKVILMHVKSRVLCNYTGKCRGNCSNYDTGIAMRQC